MVSSNLSVINEDISEFFGGTKEVLDYISQDKLDYISLFKGYVVSVNSWDLNINLSVFNILINSPITVINDNKQFVYTRICNDAFFGQNDLDKELIFSTGHAGYIILTFKSNIKDVVIDSYLLIWISHKLKNSDLSKLISYSLNTSNSANIKVQDQNEIYLSNYYLNTGEIFYRYIPGLLSINKSYNEVYQLGEEFDYNQNSLVLYPENGWYIFYQKVTTENGVKIYPLDLYQLSGLGYRRLTFSKTGSVFINTSNSHLQPNLPVANNITSNNDDDLLSTDRFIRLEGYLVYKKASDCNNKNIASGLGTINVFETDRLNCGDIFTTSIFGEDALNKTDFLDTEIFIDEDSFFNECVNTNISYPTQVGFCNNKNKALAGFNTYSEVSSTTYNKNNTLSSSRLVIYFKSITNNKNAAILNTLINISNTINSNYAAGTGNKGKLSSYGNINNVNKANAISTVPFNSGDLICINSNICSANFNYIKGLVATSYNTQSLSSSIQRRVVARAYIYNRNQTSGSSFKSVSSSNTVINHVNITSAQGLSGKLLIANCLNKNVSSVSLLTINYRGSISSINTNISLGLSSIRYLAPLARANNNNSFSVIV